MDRSSYVFTSESVSEGHPDKVADRISDTVVDAFIEKDPEARVACETLVTTNRIVLAGEVRASKPGMSKAESKAFAKEIIASLQPKVRAAVKDKVAQTVQDDVVDDIDEDTDTVDADETVDSELNSEVPNSNGVKRTNGYQPASSAELAPPLDKH